MKVMFKGDGACCGIALGRPYTLRPGENELEDPIGEELIRVGAVIPMEPGKSRKIDPMKHRWEQEPKGGEV